MPSIGRGPRVSELGPTRAVLFAFSGGAEVGDAGGVAGVGDGEGDGVFHPVVPDAVAVVGGGGEGVLLGAEGAGEAEEDGAFVAGGAGAVTTLVAADGTVLSPLAFLAVTSTRSVRPASASTRVYVVVVAPLMSAHCAPDVSHRVHWYVYVIPVPVHVPWLAVSVWPTTALPLIAGG